MDKYRIVRVVFYYFSAHILDLKKTHFDKERKDRRIVTKTDIRVVHFLLLFSISFWHLQIVCEMKNKNPRNTERIFRVFLYDNIAIIAIQHRKIYFVDTLGDFPHTIE